MSNRFYSSNARTGALTTNTTYTHLNFSSNCLFGPAWALPTQNAVCLNNRVGDPGLNLKGTRPTPFYIPATAASRVVNKGQVIASITDGFLGSAPDIGAYEFVQ